MSFPDFIIMGAMKCGTSTLYEQLAAQPAFFMSTLKEPNFFSDDEVFSRGVDWYQSLFAAAARDQIIGEASTHYTKLPTHPMARERLIEAIPNARLVYLMRHPIDRLVSHYIHDWTMGEAPATIDDAVCPTSPYVDYGRYHFQLMPYISHFGRENILPVFLERMNAAPAETLKHVVGFLGHNGAVAWRDDLGTQNISRDRVRRIPFHDQLIDSNAATALRRALVSKSLRNWIRGRLQMRSRPTLSADKHATLTAIFDQDLERLGELMGAELSCASFKNVVREKSLDWANNQ
jgi:hypothetical protein